jgi:class 3 adenylate cyclase
MGKSSPEQALVWADVTEFTQAMEASESSMALSTLAWVDRCVQGWLSELQGRFLQQAGDAVLLAFDDAHLALQAAHRLRRDWQSLGSQRSGEWGRLALGTCMGWQAGLCGTQPESTLAPGQ